MKTIKRLLIDLFPTSEVNISKNVENSLNAIFYSNYEPISTLESIRIFELVKSKFEKEISTRENNAKLELESIEKYRMTRNERLKKIINDPVFDIPVHNVEFVKPN